MIMINCILLRFHFEIDLLNFISNQINFRLSVFIFIHKIFDLFLNFTIIIKSTPFLLQLITFIEKFLIIK
jgi:hypothetical protein